MVARLPFDGPIPSGADPALLLYEELKKRLDDHDFETWFERMPCEYRSPGRFVLTAPNGFRRKWIEKRFLDLLEACARTILDSEAAIQIEVAAAETGSGQSEDPPRASPAPAGPSERERMRKSLNADLTFDTFVVGSSNQVAHAAAVAVCAAPGQNYNPLFIHGEPGCGKTHLLQAMCHRFLASTRLRVVYMTAEEFLNRFIASIANADRDSFRDMCREIDVLVIDDIQVLSQKEKTQDELFLTFNVLLEERKQIVLSSRSFPRETPEMQGRLTSRFQWGLISRLDSPNYELKVAMLLRKARLWNQELPVDVAEFLAGRVPDNSRDLEGALARTINMASLRKSSLDMETARLAVRPEDGEEEPMGSTTVARILRAVEEYYDLTPRNLLMRSKVRSLVLPRQVGMFLARELTQLSLSEIGAHFGGRDHTTVLHAQGKINRLRLTNPRISGDLELLKSRIAAARMPG